MITILNASAKAIKDFSIREWHGLDIKHYEKKVEWNSNRFRFKAIENGEVVGSISGKHESGVFLYRRDNCYAIKKRARNRHDIIRQGRKFW